MMDEKKETASCHPEEGEARRGDPLSPENGLPRAQSALAMTGTGDAAGDRKGRPYEAKTDETAVGGGASPWPAPRVPGRVSDAGRPEAGPYEAETGAGPSPDYRSHFAALCAQGAELAREAPGFSLREALSDPDFLRLTSPAVGVSVRRAWYALHGEERERAAARRAAEELSRRVASSAARPREGGRGAASGTLRGPGFDRESREALRRRVYEAAARGEKVYPE